MRVEIGLGDIELSSILIATNLLLSVASIMKRELLKTPYSQKRIIASSFIQIVTNHSIEVLLLKKFIPKISRVFDNEDDILIFSRNVRKSK